MDQVTFFGVAHEIPERRRCEGIIAQVRSERAAKSLRCAEAVEPR